MDCYDCGNCRQNQSVYFCIARNDFITSQTQPQVREKEKGSWKKGQPSYELHRRRTKQEIDNIKSIG